MAIFSQVSSRYTKFIYVYLLFIYIYIYYIYYIYMLYIYIYYIYNNAVLLMTHVIQIIKRKSRTQADVYHLVEQIVGPWVMHVGRNMMIYGVNVNSKAKEYLVLRKISKYP